MAHKYRTSFAGQRVLCDIKLNFSSIYKAVALKTGEEPLRHAKVWLCDKKHCLKATLYRRARVALVLSPQCLLEFEDMGRLVAGVTGQPVKELHRRLLLAGSAGVAHLGYA